MCFFFIFIVPSQVTCWYKAKKFPFVRSAARPFRARPTTALWAGRRFAAAAGALARSACAARSAEDAHAAGRQAPAGRCSGSGQGLSEITFLSSTQAERPMCCGSAGTKPGANVTYRHVKRIRKKKMSRLRWSSYGHI